jgi:RNA polymerase sigma-70 factor (ECF subfamily)
MLREPFLARTASQSVPDLERAQPVAAVRTEPAVFSEVFRAHAGYALQLLRHLGVREADVEDVAQEVFVVVHAQLATFEGRSTLKTWICGITLRKASEYRRKAYHRRERLGREVEDEISAATQERGLEQSEQARQLREALARLPEKQVQVFVLYEVEELSMQEIAQALGCPRFTAYTRLYAARRAVREYFASASPTANPKTRERQR